MNNHFFSKSHTDAWGFGAAMVCAVHCGMLPLILTVSSLSGLRWMSNPWLEVGFILLSFCIALLAIGRNFGKHKHILLTIKIVTVGFALIIVGHLIDGMAEYFLAAGGGITIAAGHIVNWKLAQKSACCHQH